MLFATLCPLMLWIELPNAALLSVVFLIVGAALSLENVRRPSSPHVKGAALITTPLGTALLGLTVYLPLSAIPLLLNLPVAEQPIDEDVVRRCIGYYLGGAALFFVGYNLRIGSALAGSLSKPSGNAEIAVNFSSASLLRHTRRSLLLGVGLYGIVVLLAGYTNPVSAALDMSNFRNKAYSLGWQTYVTVLMTLMLNVPLLAWLALLSNPKVKFTQQEKTAFAALAIVNIAISLSFGIRGTLVFFLVYLCVAWYYRTGRLPLSWVAIGGAAATAFITFWGQFRQTLGLSIAEKAAVEQALEGLGLSTTEVLLFGILQRLDSFRRYAEIVQGFSQNLTDDDFLYSKSILGVVLQVVPRAALPDKPMTVTTYFMEVFYPSDVGKFSFDLSLFGEGYFSYGVLGILVFALTVGILVRAMQDYFTPANLRTSSVRFTWYLSWFFFPLTLFSIGILTVVSLSLGITVMYTAVVMRELCASGDRAVP